MADKKVQEEKLQEAALIVHSVQWPSKPTDYQILDQIGAGMATNKVFKAKVMTGRHTNKLVAVKQIDLSLQSHGEARDKIQKEVLSMTMLSGSPHICGFYCSLIHEKNLWMVMELEEGSLRDVLRWKFPRGFGEPDEAVLARVLYETLQGLAFLHEFGMIHRDVKAGNILFDSEAAIKLADFGVSAIVSKQDSLRTTMAGTWHWMAPEVIDHTAIGGYDSQADIWSLGITAIELAYGDAPYGDASPMQVVVFTCTYTPPTLISPKTPNFKEPKKWSSHFQDFVSQCLKLEPHKRGTTKKLLAHKFFASVSVREKSAAVKKVLMDGLPSAGDRFLREQEAIKKKMIEAMNKNPQSAPKPNIPAKRPTQGFTPVQVPKAAPPKEKKANWSDDEILDL